MKLPLPIGSKDNPRLKQLRALLEQASARRKSQQTVLEGVHLLDAYQRAGHTPDSIWLTHSALTHAEVTPLLGQWPDVAVYILPDALYQDLRTLGPGIDVMAVITSPHPALPECFSQDVLLLDQVQDAGNVGTLLRTAAAAGVQHVLCNVGTASVWSPRVLRAGMGAQFGLQIYEHVDFKSVLPTLGLPLYATSSYATQSLYQLQLNTPCGWIMGNEGQGVHADFLHHATGVSIPQPGGQESLNVAVAGAICLFEMVRQRLA